MKNYFKFLQAKMYLGILIVLGCAMLGSVLGARKESKESLPEITERDIQILQQDDFSAPELIGVLPLAAEQNKWYNFKFAGIFGCLGILLYCILMAAYLPLYNFAFFQAVRKWLGLMENK